MSTVEREEVRTLRESAAREIAALRKKGDSAHSHTPTWTRIDDLKRALRWLDEVDA